MARLQLFLLGSPRLERDGVPLRFDTRKILALVAYVAMGASGGQGAALSRESLIALLWPDLEPKRARSVLRRNLSLLRTALEGEWLIVDRETVGTDPTADFWLDVDHFLRLVHGWQAHGHPQGQTCSQCLAGLEEAAELYRGDFLEGFGLRDSVAFDDWQFFQAENLRQELSTALQRLVQGHVSAGHPEAAVPTARRWLALDPLHEPAHQQLMRLYAQTGQRAAALRQYQECVRILDEEMGVLPAAETTALYEQIRTEAPAPGPAEAVALPLRAPAPRHNLPAQTTPFVGRNDELAEIRIRLEDPGCRLLTLLGPGGIGKTRLALQLAEDLVEAQRFEHGIFFVSLAPLQTADGIVPAVAEAVGYPFHTQADNRPSAAPRQQLLDFLRRKQLLLLMDNYEHLLAHIGTSRDQDGGDGVDFVVDVLSAAPSVKILVTSRASLKVQGEHLYPLAGLSVPEASLLPAADEWQILAGYSAVALFVQAAQQVRPDLDLRPQDLMHVVEICRLVQGMPLAILLAAAWVEMLSPEEVAAEIRRSLDFLEADLRDLPQRQHSIRAVFDHSWRLLGEREREVFQALAVFQGGFTRQAALEIVGASPRDLMSLAGKSLLQPSSAGRYQLHELLRQYAASRLEAEPERAEGVHDRHCAYFTAALERWAVELKGPRQRDAIHEIELEIENARAAWHWALAHGQVDRLARAVDGIWLYHNWRLRYEEGELAIGAAVRGMEPFDSPEGRRLRARLLVLWSHFRLDLDRKEYALESVEQARALLAELQRAGHDVRQEMALVVLQQARIENYYEPDPRVARQYYVQSIALFEEAGDRWSLARTLSYLGWIAEHLGDYAEAQRLCEKSLAIRQEIGDRRGMADAMVYLAVISWVQGQLDEANRLVGESLGIFRELDDWSRVAHALRTMGEVLVRRGRFADGLAVLESSHDTYENLGILWGTALLVPFIAEARVHEGSYEQARTDVQQGELLARRNKHRWGVAFSQFIRGLALLGEGASGEALVSLQSAAAGFDEIQHRENRGWVLGPLGLAAHREGEALLARQSVAEALKIGAELRAYIAAMYALPVAALLLAAAGAEERAVEVLACATAHSFVANSCWFQDLATGPLGPVAARLPQDVVERAGARGRAIDWQTMAAALADEL